MRGQFQLAACSALLVVAGAITACGGDDDTGEMMGSVGAGGRSTKAGSGTPSAGAGSAAAGTGGAAAGSGGGGAPAAALTCDGAKDGSGAELHAAAAAALLPVPSNAGCAFTSCHNMGSHKANLTLLEMPNDLTTQLVGKAACEVPSYQLVDTSGGDMALAKSWLWQKFVAPAGSDGQLTPKPEWGEPVLSCGQESGFGLRMPRTNTSMLLTQSKLEAVRDWICAGAPGPS
jgi:hypothetical protein